MDDILPIGIDADLNACPADIPEDAAQHTVGRCPPDKIQPGGRQMIEETRHKTNMIGIRHLHSTGWSSDPRLVLEATPKALALIGKVAPEGNAIHQALEREFGRERVERLLDILEELAMTRP